MILVIVLLQDICYHFHCRCALFSPFLLSIELNINISLPCYIFQLKAQLVLRFVFPEMIQIGFYQHLEFFTRYFQLYPSFLNVIQKFSNLKKKIIRSSKNSHIVLLVSIATLHIPECTPSQSQPSFHYTQTHRWTHTFLIGFNTMDLTEQSVVYTCNSITRALLLQH